MNISSPIGKLFLLLPRYDEHFIDTSTRSKINSCDLSSDIKIFFNFLKQFFLENRSTEYLKFLENFKKRELKLLRSLAQNTPHENFQKR